LELDFTGLLVEVVELTSQLLVVEEMVVLVVAVVVAQMALVLLDLVEEVL
jgi:hypothetical protein